MHIEHVQGGGVTYLQALVRFPGVAREESWWKAYQRRMAALSGLAEVTSAFRVCVRADGSIDRLFSAVIQANSERTVRCFFGGMALLEGLEDGSVELPASREDFEAWANDFPSLTCHLMPPDLRTADDCWLTYDFHVATDLDSIVSEAQSLGFTFGYQAHFRPFAPGVEQQRRVGRNLIALQAAQGVPEDLMLNQERQTKRFRHATLLTEEYVGVGEPEASEWLTDGLTRRFKADASRALLQPPVFDLANRNSDPAMLMHSSILYGDWEADDLLCAQAVSSEFRTSVLCYHPAPQVMSRARRSSGEPASEPPLDLFPIDVPLPPPYEGQGHIFISYRRSDLNRIVPILQRLISDGLPIWYDRGITGGDEWDVVLERKIEEAGAVLVFLSPAMVESKYCRREVKFADAIGKPLIVVVLESATLKYGLKFLLQQIQQISITDRQFEGAERRHP